MDLLALLYFMLPAYIANMAPVLVRKHLTFLASPVDGGAKLFRKRIFGDHKTYRGLLVGILAGLLISYLQHLGLPWTGQLGTYLQAPWYLLGLTLSAGALLGDLLKSFIKRQIGIPSGKSFIPFDQIDYSIGAILLTLPLVTLTLIEALVIIVTSTMLHFVVNLIGYYLNIRKQPW